MKWIFMDLNNDFVLSGMIIIPYNFLVLAEGLLNWLATYIIQNMHSYIYRPGADLDF